jgi:hypothetical protein
MWAGEASSARSSLTMTLVAEPVGQSGHRLPHVAAADDQEGGGGQVSFHVNLHLAAADAGVAAGGVYQAVGEDARFLAGQHFWGGGDDAGFEFAAADGAGGTAVFIHQHLGPGVARHGATGPDDGRQDDGFAIGLGVEQFLEEGMGLVAHEAVTL